MHRRPFSLIFLATLSVLCFGQETRIITMTGEEFRGTIVREGIDTILFKLKSGIELTVPRTSLRSIEYTTEPLPPAPYSDGAYFSLGGTVGTPSGFNLVVAGNFTREWGLRLSGLAIGVMNGIELDVVRQVDDSYPFEQSLFFGAGMFDVLGTQYYEGVGNFPEYKYWWYLAGGYIVNWHNLQGLFGLSIGTGDFFNPFPLAQIGYVHQFR